MSASKNFILQISEKLNKLDIKHILQTINNENKSIFGREKKNYNNCYRIVFNGKNAENFLHFIYKDKNIYLNRKWLKFQEYLDLRK